METSLLGKFRIQPFNFEPSITQNLMTKRLVKNCILKERRLNFSTEGTFRPVLEAAPYQSWWSLLDKVRTCIQ